MTPLEAKLQALIEADGPITVAQYMAHCLSDPEHGYYMTRDPFGAGGDFVTAPEVSQMFGEIVGAWLVHAWRLCGSPSPVRLVELGPGRGTLMADILRVAKSAPDFRNAAAVHLVETSPLLAARQAETLAQFGMDIRWHGSFAEVPPGPLLVVSNEFFDALPIRQFVRAKGSWRERVVGLIDGRLAFGIGPHRLSDGPEAPDGSVWETSPAREVLAAMIARRVVDEDGAALIVDYGHVETGPGDTMQAVRGHSYADPLGSPGEADLTAHVDFAALGRSARSEGTAVHGPVTQGEFLLSLGLLERAGRLGIDADKATRDILSAATQRLAGPAGMGTLFKVLAVTREGLTPPPSARGFDFKPLQRQRPPMHAPTFRIAPVEAPALALPGISHAFFTRQGGVSTGLYAGLNTGIGSRDDRAAVLENRARAARHLGATPERLATPYQVHGIDAVVVEAAWGPGLGPKADAVVTKRPGLAVGVGTADCGPILFADAAAGVVAAAHAGWKGALSGVLEATIEAMERAGAERARMVAVLGPTISAAAYEVGPEFVARFVEPGPENARFFRPSSRAGHSLFDLPAYIVDRLHRAGVGTVETIDLCTYSDEARFFSYRRATHRGEPDYGRQLAAITLDER